MQRCGASAPRCGRLQCFYCRGALSRGAPRGRKTGARSWRQNGKICVLGEERGPLFRLPRDHGVWIPPLESRQVEGGQKVSEKLEIKCESVCIARRGSTCTAISLDPPLLCGVSADEAGEPSPQRYTYMVIHHFAGRLFFEAIPGLCATLYEASSVCLLLINSHSSPAHTKTEK